MPFFTPRPSVHEHDKQRRKPTQTPRPRPRKKGKKATYRCLWGSSVPALTGCGSGFSTYLEMNNTQPNKLASYASTSPPTNQNFQQNRTPSPPRPRPRFSFFLAFLVLSLPPKRGAGWGGCAQRARGNEINTARRQNRFRTCRLAVF